VAGRKKILCVSSGGGHWIELLRIRPAFVGHDVVYATVDGAYRQHVAPARFHRVVDVTRWNKLRWIQCLFELLWIMMRERPDVVLSTGALPGYFAVRLGRMLGARTVWLDSFANVDELSMSGQRVGGHADLWLTQWPHLSRAGGPDYLGRVF